MNYANIFLKVFPFLLILIFVEAFLIVGWKKQKYPWQESFISFLIAIGHRISQIIPTAGFLIFAWNHRIFTISLNSWWNVVLLFLSIELTYYWFHRASHRIRWFWASHLVHHSPEHFNLSVAYRLGWTGGISGSTIFFMPLAWLGFEPFAIAIALSLNLLYQFWIHTELIPKLGFLEWFLNTPSHHRVHHASNSEYIDCNYGGVLIIFDRLFGTFTSENTSNPPIYGLTHPIKSNNPLKIALHEWMQIFKDIISTDSWNKRLCYIFAPPNWKPNYTKQKSVKSIAAHIGQSPTF
ncbi:MAG: sterol desaturase family protein [Cyanomargarita calcarea GSE-NOS-MK-12-04C]|jgi:sterol desaturase/sphingolipid hydroxylase (fatty acid hydroxylase superfamily)|uniref:Sterol desaturase family protein n=1 Tax=Cyanomargarita calcarea GSE-NOS-MK-12-04C TaxID=2839659 RepID=A0A951QS28_9CYAN|nr:sterol desaturase family protein [Cyanomargarita calcarea GSE-NOS-MK-12-04C]